MSAMDDELAKAIESALSEAAAERDMALTAGALVELTARIGDEGWTHLDFLEICNLADMAYPPGRPSVDMIYANAVTAPLVLFTLRALRNYRVRIERDPNSDSTDRRKVLAEAFGVTAGSSGGSRRGPRTDQKSRMALLSLFTTTLNAAFQSGASLEIAWTKGFTAAYLREYGSDDRDGRDERTIQRNRAQLDGFLRGHGYGAKSFQVNLKSMAM
jgi:hypothetical protein